MKNIRKKATFLGTVLLMLVVSACAINDQNINAAKKSDSQASVSQLKKAPEKIIVKNTYEGQMVVGWVERVSVGDLSYKPKAKIDSGATTSSINADIIRTFETDGKEFVVFRVDFEEDGGEHVIEAPITRWVRIKRKGGDDEYIRRPVIEMTFCIGNKKIKEEVNLADRGQFIYPVLIGRNVLDGRMLIDSSKTFTKTPSCSN